MQLADFAEHRTRPIPQQQIGHILADVTWYGQAAEDWRRGDLVIKRQEEISLDLIWQADGSARLASLPGMAITADIGRDFLNAISGNEPEDLVLQAGGMRISVTARRLKAALAARLMATIIPFPFPR